MTRTHVQVRVKISMYLHAGALQLQLGRLTHALHLQHRLAARVVPAVNGSHCLTTFTMDVVLDNPISHKGCLNDPQENLLDIRQPMCHI